MGVFVEIYSPNMHEYQKTVEMLGGILTKTIENIIRFSSQCVFDLLKLSAEKRKKQAVGSDLIRCQEDCK